MGQITDSLRASVPPSLAEETGPSARSRPHPHHCDPRCEPLRNACQIPSLETPSLSRRPLACLGSRRPRKSARSSPGRRQTPTRPRWLALTATARNTAHRPAPAQLQFPEASAASRSPWRRAGLVGSTTDGGLGPPAAVPGTVPKDFRRAGHVPPPPRPWFWGPRRRSPDAEPRPWEDGTTFPKRPQGQSASGR